MIELKKNIGIKITSFIFAIFLWFIVSSAEYITNNVYVPIKLKKVDEGYVAMSDEKVVNVVMRGSNFVLRGASTKDVKISIDVSKLKLGKNNYKIKISDVKVPKGVEILNIEPDEIVITIDKIVEKDLKIVPNIIGKPVLGYILDKIVVSPYTVRAVGAISKLNSINYLETLPVNINELAKNTVVEMPVRMDEGISTIVPNIVKISIFVKEEIVEKEFRNVPVKNQVNKPLMIKSVTPSGVRLKLKGRSDILSENAVASLVSLYCDVSDINDTGVYIKKLNYKKLNAAVEVIYIVPDVVRIEVIK
jgi:YbbR domain-containing protein